MKDFNLWAAPSLETLRDVEMYYAHGDRERMERAFAQLVPMNGPTTHCYAPLLAFAHALNMPGFPDAEDMNVRQIGAQGPSSVNCLWADFYATGDREPVLAMIAALPSWHTTRRQHPDAAVVQGAGYSVSWSLRPHLRRHGKLRAICKQEAMMRDQPLQAREELLLALSDVAKYACEGEEIATPRAPRIADFGPAPSLDFLNQPRDTWMASMRVQLPSLQALEQAIVAAEAAGDTRGAGLLCALIGYFALAARLLASHEIPLLPKYELAMAFLQEGLARHRLGEATRAFDHAIEIFDQVPDELPWLGAALESRVQRALCTRDAAHVAEALARVREAARGPFGDKLGTLVRWAESHLPPTR